MKRHKSITIARVQRLAEKSMFGLESPGLCTACGSEADQVEPDAEGYTCNACGEEAVYGAEQLLFAV